MDKSAMTVDLSKAKAGDTVKFRCGGQAVIKVIDKLPGDFYNLEFVSQYYTEIYKPSGAKFHDERHHAMDITEVISAPEAFDWSTAKWGMAFKKNETSVVWYVGKSCVKTSLFFEFGINGGEWHTLERAKALLIRSPEHDVKGAV